MDFYEQLVQTYLTVFEACPVLPQAAILRSTKDEPWEAYLDFLALDFVKRRIQVVEVSKATDPAKASELAAKLRPEYRENVEHYIKGVTLNKHLEFPIHWRFFVRRSNASLLSSAQPFREYIAAGGQAEVTVLEDVFDKVRDLMP